ncbi:MAG: bifunctional DNA-formamidopyrimidine glycosylase/DNA-(apurinic or apyrimidinic site) lyase, partial [Phycisphaerales bacterium]
VLSATARVLRPELPEVEHLRRSLMGLVWREVTGVTLHRRDVLRSRDGRRDGRVQGLELLRGMTIVELERHGKQLAIHAAGGSLLVHLGMSGSMTHWSGRRASESHVHVTWRLDDGSGLRFRDPRRFGGLWSFEDAETLRQRRWSGLGPDALAIRGATLQRVLSGTRRPIKAALLDQSVIAGVGNIYADEALHAAGVHPLTPASEVRDAGALAARLRSILRQAVSRGGSTIRDYRDGTGRAGEAQRGHEVYGRAGQACTGCSAELIGIRVAQRQTVFCPHCQPEVQSSDLAVRVSVRSGSLGRRGKAQSS